MWFTRCSAGEEERRRVQGAGCGVRGAGCRVLGAGCGVLSLYTPRAMSHVGMAVTSAAVSPNAPTRTK